MNVIRKNTATEHLQPTYYVRFKDTIVLPVALNDDTKLPTLKLIRDNQVNIIKLWNGKVLYDMDTGTVDGNDGEFTLSFLDDISNSREVTSRYVFKTNNIRFNLDIDYLSHNVQGSFKASSRHKYFKVNAQDKTPLLIDKDLMSVVATLISAITLNTANAYRLKNLNSKKVFVKSLRDVIINGGYV